MIGLPQATDLPIAVVGLACRTAGAENPDELWQLLTAGKRMIRPVSPHRLPSVQPGPVAVGVPHAALMDDIDGFDAGFFGISRRMASWMDPNQRMLLELTQHALDSAALDSDRLRGVPVGVFAAAPMSDYRERMVQAGAVDSAAFPGTLNTFAANRISYEFDWTGPSYTIDSACSSGLHVLASALLGLRSGEFPIAAVLGANLTCNGFYTSSAYRAGALSPTGESVPFSAHRDGYLRGEGGACLILKPLRDAVRDGDPIQAVIRGVGLAHSGRAGGLTGTDPISQAQLITRTAGACGVPVRSIGYFEAHGPGTRGDADEVQAIGRALLAEPAGTVDNAAGPGERLWIGSIKSNIGHLESAAGLLGLVKAALILRHGLIPRVAGLSQVDPDIDVRSAPVAIADHDTPWPPAPTPRRIGVNSFGVGGALATAIMEEAPSLPDEVTATGGTLVFPLSAVDDRGLRAVAAELRAALGGNGLSLESIAWTLQSGRPALRVRRAIITSGRDELRVALAALAEGETHPAAWSAGAPGPAGLPAGERSAALADWLGGARIDWPAFWAGDRMPRRVSLPGYPFSHSSFWFNSDRPTTRSTDNSD
jgi:acyl transferase domain-containing protein